MSILVSKFFFFLFFYFLLLFGFSFTLVFFLLFFLFFTFTFLCFFFLAFFSSFLFIFNSLFLLVSSFHYFHQFHLSVHVASVRIVITFTAADLFLYLEIEIFLYFQSFELFVKNYNKVFDVFFEIFFVFVSFILTIPIISWSP